jgi:hypothetical protein
LLNDKLQGGSVHRVAFLCLSACAFVAAYILLLAALLYANLELFTPRGRRLDQWHNYWGAYVIFYSPAAVTALLAAWYSRLSPQSLSVLLGAFVVLIGVVFQWTLLQRTGGGALLIGELVTLTVAFFAIALVCRSKTRRSV